MNTEQINDNEHVIRFYDWVEKHDDYDAGVVKRNPAADEESDERFWLFYPNGSMAAINAGDLNRLAVFIADLNRNDRRHRVNGLLHQ